MKELEDIFPVTIINDRYGGCYSKGAFLAFNLEPWDVPKGVSWGGDVDCAEFWADEAPKYVIGKGNTPNEAYRDLVEKLQTKEKEPNNHQLDPKNIFENFIEGASNKMARTMGHSIAEHPDESSYNPFFIYGPSGCGKTHLINAIGMRRKEINLQERVVYVTARQFKREFTESVLQNTTNDFIDFYQSIDVLIVDDIQEWMDAPKTLDSFFQIFNDRIRKGKQIVLACDRPPVELKEMKKRLLTHISCGVVAELEMPNEELCVDILHAKCIRDGLEIPDETIEFVAKTASGNVLVLEGVFNSLKAYSIVCDSNIDTILAERLIKNIVV